MASINLTKVTIGGPEVTPGTPVARQFVVPLRAVPDLDKKVERALDPAMIGRNMDAAEYPIADNVGGGLPLTPRPNGGYGKIVKSLLGEEEVKQGYQELGLTGKTGASDTLLTAATTYNFKMTVDGGTQTNCSITTGAGPTIDYDELITLATAEMTAQSQDCTWSIWGGDVRIVSDAKASPSTIDIAAGDSSDLLAALDGGATPDTAVSGAPLQVAGCIRIRYTGSDASCLLESDQAGNTLTSKTGVKTSESLDTNFGVSGEIDFDTAAYDTLGEVVTAIDGYTDYSCEKVFGSDSLDLITNMVEHAISGQGKSMWAYIYFESSSSGVYRHILRYDTSQDELPNYSVQVDGRYDNMLYDAIVTNGLSVSAALKGMAEADADFLGFEETIGQTASTLTLEDIDPMIFHKGSFSFGEEEYTLIRNISTEFTNNHNAEGYGQGSLSRQYHQKGKFDASGEMQVRLDATSYAERAKVFANTLIAVSYYFYGKDYSTDIPELIITELPYCNVQDFTFTENNGVYDATIPFKVFYPKGTLYNNPVRMHMLTQDSAEY